MTVPVNISQVIEKRVNFYRVGENFNDKLSF